MDGLFLFSGERKGTDFSTGQAALPLPVLGKTETGMPEGNQNEHRFVCDRNGNRWEQREITPVSGLREKESVEKGKKDLAKRQK